MEQVGERRAVSRGPGRIFFCPLHVFGCPHSLISVHGAVGHPPHHRDLSSVFCSWATAVRVSLGQSPRFAVIAAADPLLCRLQGLPLPLTLPLTHGILQNVPAVRRTPC